MAVDKDFVEVVWAFAVHKDINFTIKNNVSLILTQPAKLRKKSSVAEYTLMSEIFSWVENFAILPSNRKIKFRKKKFFSNSQKLIPTKKTFSEIKFPRNQKIKKLKKSLLLQHDDECKDDNDEEDNKCST